MNEEKEINSPDKNNSKKRDRDEDEGNSPTRKRVRNSPNKRKGRKSKIEKAKNFNKKYKKARKCKDCEGEDEEKCVLCGKGEHICESEMEVNRKCRKGHVWIWICQECSEIMGDEGVIEEMKEVVKREKERKRNIKDTEVKEKIYSCKLCDEVIRKRQISVECTHCKLWVHLKCSKFENIKEARDSKDTYVCAKCVKGNGTPQKKDTDRHPVNVEEMNGNEKLFESGGVKMYESDLETLRDGKWFTDSILSFAFNEMDEKYDRHMVFVKPEISQLIKLSTDEDEVEKTIRNLGLRKADWVFFPVNNNETEEEGGSHWSLLLYSGNGNIFYHFDPITGANDCSVATLIKKLVDSEKKIPEIRYVKCPRQKNGYDCGPFTLRFAEIIAENIKAGKDITEIEAFDAREFRSKLRNQIVQKFNLKKDENQEPFEKENKRVTKEPVKKDKKKECWHYTNNKCKFGTNCIYEHKEPCKETIENGYCFDNNCKKGHPRICNEIYETGRCKRYVCKYFHPINLRNKNHLNKTSKNHGSNNMQNSFAYLDRGNNNPVMQNEHNQWERRENRGHFLENRNRGMTNWMEPLMERAIMDFRNRIWDMYRQDTTKNYFHGK